MPYPLGHETNTLDNFYHLNVYKLLLGSAPFLLVMSRWTVSVSRAVMPILHSEDEDSSSGDEYESSDESEEEQTLKPVFVRKENRMTIKEAEKQQHAEEQTKAKQRQKEEERKAQTRILVAESIRKTEEQSTHFDDADSDAGLPDDTDDLDDEVEYNAWKVREMARLTRDAEEREEAIIEKTELLRRRNMTDEERMEEDRKLGRLKENVEEKPKRKFMQKYFHRGVFYMDQSSIKKEDDVRNKDYAAEPTMWDKVNVENLPAVMQVKNFGKRGRTKYTHLLDQDTTVRDKKRIDVRPDARLMDKYLNNRSGVGKLQ
jgi:microfibrillar-associated protein 1